MRSPALRKGRSDVSTGQRQYSKRDSDYEENESHAGVMTVGYFQPGAVVPVETAGVSTTRPASPMFRTKTINTARFINFRYFRKLG